MAVFNFTTIDPSLVLFNYELGAALPAVQPVDATVDIIDAGGNFGYSNLYLVVNSSATWLSAALQSAPEINNPVEFFNIDYSLVPSQVNQLIPGSYTANVSYTIYGTNISSGGVDVLSQTIVPVSVSISNANTIIVDPTLLKFSHTLGQAIPLSKTITLNGLDWKVETPAGFTLSSQDVNVVITNNPDGSTLAEGTGTVNLEILLKSSILLQVSNVNYIGSVKDINGNVVATFTINVRVISDETFEVSPSSLSFLTIKNASNAVAKTLSIDSALAFTITKPVWLLVDPAIGQNLVLINVQPDPASDLDPGIYNDVITISRDIDGVQVDSTIAIKFEVVDFIRLPGIQGDFWFTLDNKELEVFTIKTDTFFQLKLTAVLFDFYTSIEKIIELPYKIPLFKNQQKFNIGKIIDRLMFRLDQYDDNTQAQYKPSNIELYIEEISLGDQTVLQTALLSNIKYVAGISPDKIIDNSCFLDLNPSPTRVTINSFVFLNLLLKTGNYTLKLYKNGGFVNDTSISAATDNIFTRKIFFTDYKKGDVIEYKIQINGDELIKTFIVLPESKESYHMVWENEYKLKSALEFTGAFSLKNEIINVLQKSYKNGVEILEKIKSSSEGKFIGNTGFVFKTDQVTVESLLRAKKGWLILNDGTIIKIIPLTKSITSINSEQDLFSYDVEFQINKDFDAQSYSF